MLRLCNNTINFSQVSKEVETQFADLVSEELGAKIVTLDKVLVLLGATIELFQLHIYEKLMLRELRDLSQTHIKNTNLVGLKFSHLWMKKCLGHKF